MKQLSRLFSAITPVILAAVIALSGADFAARDNPEEAAAKKIIDDPVRREEMLHILKKLKDDHARSEEILNTLPRIKTPEYEKPILTPLSPPFISSPQTWKRTAP